MWFFNNKEFGGNISHLFVYPIKSLSAIEVPFLEVTPGGFKYDRGFMFVFPDKNFSKSNPVYSFLTQRENPAMVLAKTSFLINSKNIDLSETDTETDTETELLISYPENGNINDNYKSFKIPLSENSFPTPTENDIVKVKIWDDIVSGQNVTYLIDPDFFKALSFPSNTLFIRNIQHRNCTRMVPDHLRKNNQLVETKFVDYYPAHLITTSSLRDLAYNVCNIIKEDNINQLKKIKTNQELNEFKKIQNELESSFKYYNSSSSLGWISRFRPNIVINNINDTNNDSNNLNLKQTIKPYDEETWKKISFTSNSSNQTHEWSVTCRNVRCNVPTVNPKEGDFEPNRQPYKAMQSFRRVDPGAKYQPCFGMNMANIDYNYIISKGDPINVLERGEHFYIKMASE